jgi:ABC-type multidrug transport system ATPase subunit
VIEAIDLTVRRRGAVVLDAVSFDVRPGQVTGVLGLPGAGKTTLLRRMVQLDRGTGCTLFDGLPYRSLRHPLREVGLALDRTAGHPDLTVRARLRLALAADPRAARERGTRNRPGRRIDAVLDIVGLTDEARTPLHELSDPMAARLAVGAALVGDPRTLILDGLDGALEPEGVAWLGALLRAYTAQGRAALITGSDTDAMLALADRLLLLDGGALVGVRTTEEVLRTPPGTAVVVRSPQIIRFGAILEGTGVRTVHGRGASLEVHGLDRARVGDLAYRYGIPVHELAERRPGSDPADSVLASCCAPRPAHLPGQSGDPGSYSPAEARLAGLYRTVPDRGPVPMVRTARPAPVSAPALAAMSAPVSMPVSMSAPAVAPVWSSTPAPTPIPASVPAPPSMTTPAPIVASPPIALPAPIADRGWLPEPESDGAPTQMGQGPGR